MSRPTKPKTRAANGQGTITSLSPTKHLVRLPVGFYPNGQVKYKTHTVNGPKKDAQALRTTLLHRQQRGLSIAPQTRTVAAYLDYWLEAVVKRTARPATYQLYAKLIRLHIARTDDPHLGHIRVQKLTRAQVQALANAKLDSGLSVATVQRTIGVLRAALNYLVENDDLPKNAAAKIKLPKNGTFKPHPLDPAEALRFLRVARHDRLAAAWFLAALGLREGELLGLRRSRDVDLTQRVVYVRGQLSMATGVPVLDAPTKTGDSVRAVPIPDMIAALLSLHFDQQDQERRWNSHRWQDHDLVFCTTIGTPIRPRSLLRWYHGLLAEAGLSRRRFHDMRHSCASLLRAMKVDPRVVQALVGHTTTDQTDHYTTVFPATLREAIGSFDRLFDAALADVDER